MTPDREMDEERFLIRHVIGGSKSQSAKRDLLSLRKSWERKAEARGIRRARFLISMKPENQMRTEEVLELDKLADAIEGGAE